MAKMQIMLHIEPTDFYNLQIKVGKGNVSSTVRRLIGTYLALEHNESSYFSVTKAEYEKEKLQEQIEVMRQKCESIDVAINQAKVAEQAINEQERQAQIKTEQIFAKQYLSDALTGRLGSAAEEKKEAERNAKDNTKSK